MIFLNHELAEQIVERTMNIIHRNINVMNEKGVIIGSGEKERINQIHDGAVAVIKSQSVVEIDEVKANYLKGAKPGVNLPIFFRNEIVGVVGITGPPEEIRGYGELVKMAAEMILEQAFLLEQIQWDQRLKEEVIHQIVVGNLETDPWFLERAKILGISFQIPRVAVIIEIKVNQLSEKELLSRRKKVVSTLQNLLDNDDLMALGYTTDIILFKKIKLNDDQWNEGQTLQQLRSWGSRIFQLSKVKTTMSIGSYYPEIAGLSLSYHEAMKTLEVGKHLFPDIDIYSYQEMGFPTLLVDLPKTLKHPLFEVYQRIVQNDKKGELQQTLKVFIEENGEVNHTAEKLFIHRNTLHYRLEKIKEMTGKDPKKLKDLLDLYISMLLNLLNSK
ncbi:sugar diacid recognition domain-containing protein [Tepidibacillus decaturensis]|uniref:Transcriptional regulator n=1 Tax=Tepidibacillus decaturensis TaxID=1413211 RepID=A0A135L3U6_9BACI|nr:sugar diacid recognition domain-containing protein [Tepidibacillus decaturensis]KXG43581.1 transcriptional regulator [Tepidibacillus decaturensis]